MSLSISYFNDDHFSFDTKSFISFWTEIQTLLKKTYELDDNVCTMCDELKIFDFEFEKIKQKKFYEFTNPKDESIILRDIIHQILQKSHMKTPIMIIKTFYDTIKDHCSQISYGNNIYISRPEFNPVLSIEKSNYDIFFKYICGFNYDHWPHHYKMRPEIYELTNSIPIEVYFALISIGSYMFISKEPTVAHWGN
jgi:hypothetical protein